MTTLEVPKGVELVKFAAGCVIKPDFTPEAIAIAERTKDQLVHFKRGLLPLEDADSVENRLGQAIETVGRMRFQQVITRLFGGKYQILDPSVFDLRDSTGMPRLMPFSIKNPEAGFVYGTVENELGFMDSPAQMSRQPVVCDMFPSFPIHITEHYLDVIELVKARAKHLADNASLKFSPFRRQSVQLKMLTRFGGYIPDEVKWEMVNAWTSGQFEHLYIVSEVRDWQENLTVISVQGDPLVVGFDGYQFWLIAAFDTTTLEEQIKDEYCIKVGN